MKRLLLFKSLFVAALATCSLSAIGQLSNMDILGARLVVDAPSPNAGLKKFTYSSNPTMTGPWGRALDSIWQHVEVVRTGGDSLGCSNLNSYAGKWALIWRGTCQFGEKALYAQQKGAKGVIIINNVPGADPVGMAAGSSGGSVTIPVLMVSNPDGAAMWNELGTSQVYISLTRWGFNKTNDLALVPGSGAPGPGAIPLKQWTAGAPPANYKYFNGAFIANTGSAPMTGIKVASSVSFTPTGGSSSVVYSDTTTISGVFNPSDSIFEALSPNTGTLNPTTTGRYTITYTVFSATSDDYPADNTWSTYFDVTNNIFSKARVDASGNPIITASIRPNSQTNYCWGPLFYVTKGGYKAQSVRMAFSDGDTSKHSLQGQLAAAYIFKWVDGSNGGSVDNYMQPRELTVKGLAYKELSSADSPGRIITALVGNSDGTAGTVTLEDNSWYWVCANMDQNLYLSVDEGYNYFNRTNAAKHATTSVTDFWAPIYLGSKSNLDQKPTDTARMIPFGFLGSSANSNNIDSAFITLTDNSVPAMALELSPFPVNIENAKSGPTQVDIFPNPTTDVINVKLSLTSNAPKAYIRVIDAVGRTISTTERQNVQNETVAVSTKGLTPGNYYVVVIANGYGITKPFTISGK